MKTPFSWWPLIISFISSLVPCFNLNADLETILFVNLSGLLPTGDIRDRPLPCPAVHARTRAHTHSLTQSVPPSPPSDLGRVVGWQREGVPAGVVGCRGCGPDTECSFLICSEFLVLGEICLFLLVSLFLTMLLLGSSFPDQGLNLRPQQ